MAVFVIAVVLPKSVHAAYIAENANVYSFNLSENDMAFLTSLDQGHKICWSPADVL
jgi:diketogulonate reductase-like aldo/keto reductase